MWNQGYPSGAAEPAGASAAAVPGADDGAHLAPPTDGCGSKRSILLTNPPCPAEFNPGYSLEETLKEAITKILMPSAGVGERVCDIIHSKPEGSRGQPYSATAVFATVEDANRAVEHIRREDIWIGECMVMLGSMRWNAAVNKWMHDPTYEVE